MMPDELRREQLRIQDREQLKDGLSLLFVVGLLLTGFSVVGVFYRFPYAAVPALAGFALGVFIMLRASERLHEVWQQQIDEEAANGDSDE